VAPPSLPSKSPSPLMPFNDNWIGGDIHGLSSYAGTMYGYVPKISDVVSALNSKVTQIVSDAGWQGGAASAFTSNWEKVSAETNSVGLVIIDAGDIVDQLAVDLAKIENALEKAAATAASNGVQVGGNGQPPQQCYASKTQEDWRQGYGSFYQESMVAAQKARVQAAGALQTLFGMMTGKNADGSSLGTQVGEGSTVVDYLADLLATPSAYAGQVASKVEELTQKAGTARQAWLAAQAAARGADGRFGVMPDDVKQALRDAKTQLASAESDLATAQSNENAFTKILDTRMSDLPGLSKAADGLSDASVLGKVLDLPVVDVLAGTVNTVVNAQDDMAHGMSGWEAYPLEAGGTIASLAAGGAVAGVVGGAVAGLSIAGAPVLGIAAGAAAGGVVAYGVGDYIHNYIKDFGEQWHEHGALGIITDFGAAGVGTWDDTKQLAGDIGHAASGAWHAFTSLF
jgi:uncharacterized protein YukE